LTRSLNTHTAIRWAPDGEKISFKTDRKFKDTKKGNLWVMPLTGGEPYPVTQFEKGVDLYVWLDAGRILFSASEEDTLRQKEIKEQKDTSETAEDEDHRIMRRLFLYDLKNKKVTRLTDNKKPVLTFSQSRDKKHVLYSLLTSVRYVQDHEIPPKYYLMNLDTKKTREILTDMHVSPSAHFAWAFDNSGFYFSRYYNTHPKYVMCAVVKIYHYDLGTHTYKEVPLNWERYAVKYKNPVQAIPRGFVVQLADGVHSQLARFTHAARGKGWKRDLIKGKEYKNIETFKLSRDGRTMVYRYSTASRPPRYYTAELKGNQIVKRREIMDIKSPLFKKPLAKTEVRTWTGAKNETVEGVLYYPYNYESGKKYPLILMIHGGPNGADMDAFEDNWIYPAHLWCERGAFVLKPNYHGSSNYGIDFGESISGHYYELEVPDIEAGVDMLIAEGKVDKEKLGVIGHSNGAILGTALLLNSPRYKVAGLFAGDVNWTSDYGNCRFGVAFDNYYFGGPPWENPDYYVKISPLFQMKKITTPTLIFHGDKDRAVPFSQGWEFYRALQVIGKVPVRFIIFPGETHVPKKLGHQRRKLKEEIAWFEKYLFNTYKPRNESLKKDSPLDLLERTRAFARHQGLFGVMEKGVLIPEVVEYSDRRIGRFEVIRAQWAAFNKSYRYEPGTGNYPITGISYDDAKKYTELLSLITGKTYRLPAGEEIDKFYNTPCGNTLDYWAGYKVNPDDFTNLKEILGKYKDDPVLLKPVGFFPAKGKNLIFDLGGNAAEWVMKDGKGRVAGGSAVIPEDTRSAPTPPLSYVGFRVVLDSPSD
jgi:dipeptidyl aminopeptidase/acylaminoacyl peptidase